MIYLFNKDLAIFLIVFLLPVFLIVAILIFLESSGPIFFFTHSIGKNGNIFKMPKFRTMHSKSPNIASNLLGRKAESSWSSMNGYEE